MSDDRIAELEQRVAVLERFVGMVKTITPAPTMPVQPAGCVCPVGAEQGCGNSFCPRRGYRLQVISYGLAGNVS